MNQYARQNAIATIPVISLPEERASTRPDLDSYDNIIVAFSGGKDSIACVLKLLEQGVPSSKIELWHHCVDGKNNEHQLMDWPVTEDYCRQFAKALNLKIYFSWKHGGFLGEMLRENALTKPASFETPDGVKTAGGQSGKRNTRLKFPQVAANLRVRWCSAYLKIDVSCKALVNQPRFHRKRTLFVTGERAQESPARSRYNTFETHSTDRRHGRLSRHVDAYRPVHGWSEQQVWNIIERFKVNPHPAYKMGWGRLSCMTCIFGSPRQWASVKRVSPARFQMISEYEQLFDCTIHRSQSIEQRSESAQPYKAISDELIAQAMSPKYTGSVITESWSLPAGAFGESTGPL